MATEAPGALSGSRAPGAHKGHSQDPAWSTCRSAGRADRPGLGHPEAQAGSAHPQGGGRAAPTDPSVGEEAEGAGPPPRTAPAGPGLSPLPPPGALLGLGAVLPAAPEARVGVYGEPVLLAHSPHRR